MRESVVIFRDTVNVDLAELNGRLFQRADHNPRMATDPYNADARRRVLQSFIDRNKLKVQTWTNACGLSESVLRSFLAGRSESMSDRTYARLAAGAAKLLERNVDAATLRGDPPPHVEVPLLHYVGAGDQVYPIDGNDDAIDYTEAPPGYHHGGAAIVRGDSMRPLFEPGDIVFWRQLERPPNEPTKRAVLVQVKDGPLLLKKILPGTKRGLYYLLSLNPTTPVMNDQPVEAIARIGWVRPAG